ncbi:putative hebreain [Ixodes scapularis]
MKFALECLMLSVMVFVVSARNEHHCKKSDAEMKELISCVISKIPDASSFNDTLDRMVKDLGCTERLCAVRKLCDHEDVLLLTAITNAPKKTFTEDDLKRIYLFCAPQNDCFLRRCEKCPKTQSISLQSLHLDEDQEICFALWDAGELVKKVMDTSAFLRQ